MRILKKGFTSFPFFDPVFLFLPAASILMIHHITVSETIVGMDAGFWGQAPAPLRSGKNPSPCARLQPLPRPAAKILPYIRITRARSRCGPSISAEPMRISP